MSDKPCGEEGGVSAGGPSSAAYPLGSSPSSASQPPGRRFPQCCPSGPSPHPTPVLGSVSRAQLTRAGGRPVTSWGWGNLGAGAKGLGTNGGGRWQETPRPPDLQKPHPCYRRPYLLGSSPL